MKKFFSFASFALIFMLLLTACGSGEEVQPANSETNEETEEKDVSVKIGTQPWVGYGPWWIADAEGIFEKHNIDAELVNFIQDSDLNAAFASDNIQVASIATHTAMKMVGNNGLDIKTIAFLDESLLADAMITRDEFKSIEDLKGKKVAFEEGTTSDLLFRQALSDHNMSMEDFEIVYMPASDAGLALLSNNVDAAVTYEPYISNITDKDSSVHVIYSGENSPGLISDIAVVKNEYLDANPELIDTLQQIWDESMKFWQENPERGNEIIAKESGIEADQLPPILEGIHFFTFDEQVEVAQSGELAKKLEDIKAVLLSQDGLEDEVVVEDMLAIQ